MWTEVILKAAVAVLVLALTGCKTDTASRDSSSIDKAVAPASASASDTSNASQIVPDSRQKDGRALIVCFGDSLTAGLGLDADETYPADLQGDLDAAGYRYRVSNLGVSGETTKDGLARVDNVIAMKPAIVVVEFGGNDGLRGIPISDSRANLDAILEKLKASKTQIALAGITLPPQYGQDYIRKFDETYSLLAKKYSVPMIPFVLQDAYGTAGDIQRDGVHPTAAGAKVVAKNVLGLILFCSASSSTPSPYKYVKYGGIRT